MRCDVTFLVLFILSLAATRCDAQQDRVLAAKIDAIFAAFDRDDAPGMAVGVVRKGRLIHARGFGRANLEHDVPITPKTMFRIASTSKQFTAACIAQLAIRGKLDLDSDVRAHVPEFSAVGPPVTVRSLLHHTSGVRDYLGLHFLAGARERDWYSPADSIAMICRQRGRIFETGSAYRYSNSNYLLLGEIVRRVAEESLADYARKNLFEPLGMFATHFHDRADHVCKRRAGGYARDEDGSWRVDETQLEHCGDGGVFTSIEELAKWDRLFYEPRLVAGRKLVELMRTRGRLASGEEIDYAFGLKIRDWRGVRVESHGGAYAGFRTQMMRFPEHGLTVIVLANLAQARASWLAKRMAEACLGAALGPTPPTAKRPGPPPSAPRPPKPTREALAPLAGIWRSDELDVRYHVEALGGCLRVTVGRRRGVMTPLGGDDFTYHGMAVSFERDAEGRAIAFTVARHRTGSVRFTRETSR